jgi:hypothetical protein
MNSLKPEGFEEYGRRQWARLFARDAAGEAGRRGRGDE